MNERYDSVTTKYGMTSPEVQEPTCPLCHGRGMIVGDDADNAYDAVDQKLCHCVLLRAQARYISRLPRQRAIPKDAPTLPAGNFFINLSAVTLTSMKIALLTHQFPEPFRYVIANQLKEIYFGSNPELPSIAALVLGREQLHILDLFQNLVDPTESSRGSDSMLDKILSMYVTQVVTSGRTLWILSRRELQTFTGFPRTREAITEQQIRAFPATQGRKE